MQLDVDVSPPANIMTFWLTLTHVNISQRFWHMPNMHMVLLCYSRQMLRNGSVLGRNRTVPGTLIVALYFKIL